ncbi:MAG: phage portal protein [Chloroflexi bacterium]|nr:phage portal protein [Chloroflexota bacterium]MBU1748685.1 phage portal protein [Chloroflexota bacterium]
MGVTQTFLYDGQRAVPLNRLEQWLLGHAGDADTTVDEAYQSVAWLYRGVHLRADAVASMPYTLWQGETDVTARPDLAWLCRLLHHLLWLNEASLILMGASYWLVDVNKFGRNPTPRWAVPSSMHPEHNDGVLTGFTRTVGGRSRPVPLDRVVYWWVPSLFKELGPGTPPAQVALAAAGVLRNADRMIEAFFQRGAINVTLLAVEGNPPQPEIDKLERWWKRLITGMKRAYEAVAIRASIKPVVIGSSLRDASADELTQRKREDIAVALGVPPSLLFQEAAYATARHEDRLTFITQTIMPECTMMEGPLNEFLARRGLRYEFQPERLEVMQTAQLAQATAVAQLAPGPLLTRDEARGLLGYGPWPADEVAGARPEPAPNDGDSSDQSDEPSGPEGDEAMRADLRRWRDKARRRGVGVEFSSTTIPAPVQAAIRTALDLVGADAWRFLRAAADSRDELEARLRETIALILAQRQAAILAAIEAQQNPDYAALEAELLAALVPELTVIATEEALRLAVEIGVQFDPAIINQAAARWARQYGYDLVKGLVATTRATVSQAIEQFVTTPGMTREQLVALLAPTFGPVRAEMIAITEVTRAYSAATNEYQAMLDEAGITMERYWWTRNDERVCPICGPLHNQPEDVWRSAHPTGPPAHIRCRCGTVLRYVKGEA